MALNFDGNDPDQYSFVSYKEYIEYGTKLFWSGWFWGIGPGVLAGATAATLIIAWAVGSN